MSGLLETLSAQGRNPIVPASYLDCIGLTICRSLNDPVGYSKYSSLAHSIPLPRLSAAVRQVSEKPLNSLPLIDLQTALDLGGGSLPSASPVIGVWVQRRSIAYAVLRFGQIVEEDRRELMTTTEGALRAAVGFIGRASQRWPSVPIAMLATPPIDSARTLINQAIVDLLRPLTPAMWDVSRDELRRFFREPAARSFNEVLAIAATIFPEITISGPPPQSILGAAALALYVDIARHFGIPEGGGHA